MMSEETVAVEVAGSGTDAAPIESPQSAPEQPKAEKAQEQPKEQPKKPPSHLSRRDQARHNARERARAAQEAQSKQEPQESTGEQPRDDRGRFQAKAENQQEQRGAVSPTASETPGNETPAASPVAEGFVRIEIPKDHPLREQGRTHWDVRSEDERDLRAALNQWTRRSEKEEAEKLQKQFEQRLEQERIQRLRVQAELEAMKAGVPSLENNPDLDAALKDIERAWGGQKPEVVEFMKNAVREQFAREQQAAHEAAFSRVQMGETTDRFLSTVQTSAAQQFPVWNQTGELNARMSQALGQYGDMVDARNAQLAQMGRPHQPPSADEFFRYVRTSYVGDARVQKQIQDMKNKREAELRERIRQEERKKLQEAQAQKRQEVEKRHSTRPPAPSGQLHRAHQTSGEDDSFDLRKVPVAQRGKALRERVKARMRGEA